ACAGRRGRGGKHGERERETPKQSAVALMDAVSKRRASMKIGALPDGMPGANGAPPPLAKAAHGGIVRGHRTVELRHFVAGKAKANAELGVLACDHVGPEPPDFAKRGATHHRYAA